MNDTEVCQSPNCLCGNHQRRQEINPCEICGDPGEWNEDLGGYYCPDPLGCDEEPF